MAKREIKRRWYVMSAVENQPSWSSDKDAAEVFWTKAAAIKRARQLAENEPHVGFHICATTDVIFVETKPVEQVTLRVHG